MIAVQEVTRPKSLPTSASTPCNTNIPGEQAPTPLAPQRITQEEEFDLDDQTDQHKNLFANPHDRSSPAAQQGLETGSRLSNHICIEGVDDSESEEVSGDSQHSANLDVWPSADHSDNLHDQDTYLNGQISGQTVTSSTLCQSNTRQYISSKREHNFEDSSASKRTHIEAAPYQSDERHDQQPNILEAGQDGQPSTAAVVTPPAPPQTVVRSQHPSSESPDAVDLPEGESGKFTKLPATLRAKVRRIADTATLATRESHWGIPHTASPIDVAESPYFANDSLTFFARSSSNGSISKCLSRYHLKASSSTGLYGFRTEPC